MLKTAENKNKKDAVLQRLTFKVFIFLLNIL